MTYDLRIARRDWTEESDIADRLNEYRNALEVRKANMDGSNIMPFPTRSRAWIKTDVIDEALK
jgi:hypothetical protein